LELANTNKWFSEVLKDKIKKHRQSIRECNSVAVCYGRNFLKASMKEFEEDFSFFGSRIINKNRNIWYFHCINCF